MRLNDGDCERFLRRRVLGKTAEEQGVGLLAQLRVLIEEFFVLFVARQIKRVGVIRPFFLIASDVVERPKFCDLVVSRGDIALFR